MNDGTHKQNTSNTSATNGYFCDVAKTYMNRLNIHCSVFEITPSVPSRFNLAPITVFIIHY